MLFRSNGLEALGAVRNSLFDLVLMDMAMPVMDGAEATRRIRELDSPQSGVPIVALTAYARPEELRPMTDAGADASASKPVMIEDLHRVMAKLLAGT